MSVHARTLLLGAAAAGLFIAGSLQAVPTHLAGVLILAAIAVGASIAFLRCPRCGERVSRRPSTLFGRRVNVGAPLLHSTCYFCGRDLRQP